MKRQYSGEHLLEERNQRHKRDSQRAETQKIGHHSASIEPSMDLNGTAPYHDGADPILQHRSVSGADTNARLPQDGSHPAANLYMPTTMFLGGNQSSAVEFPGHQGNNNPTQPGVGLGWRAAELDQPQTLQVDAYMENAQFLDWYEGGIFGGAPFDLGIHDDMLAEVFLADNRGQHEGNGLDMQF